MYWIIDVLAILFVLVFALYGLKTGFFGSSINLLLVIACIGGSAYLSYLTVFFAYPKWDINETFTEMFIDLLGYSKIPGGQEIVNQVAAYIALGLLFLVTFIIYDIILHLLRKLILHIVGKIRKNGFFHFIGNFLGCTVNLVLALGLVFSLLSTAHAFKDSKYILRNANEAIQSTEILSLVYDNNPLNQIIDDTGIAETVESTLDNLVGNNQE